MFNLGSSRVRKLKQAAISAFLLFHIVAITCWCVPSNALLFQRVRSAVRPYFLWSGLFQAWDMFAPSPRNINAYLEAVVVFNNGQTYTWKFPRMEQLGYVERYYKERYRKFEEILPAPENSALWPDVSRHIARLNSSSTRQPEFVILIEYWSEILPPAPDGSYHAGQKHARIFYEYKVNPEDVQ